MKSMIFAVLGALLALFLAGCTSRADVENAAKAAVAPVVAANIALTRENEMLKTKERERQAIVDASSVCRKEAWAADYRHVNACKTVPFALAMNATLFAEFRPKMEMACANACRQTTLELASDRLIKARAAKKADAKLAVAKKTKPKKG